ncbi:MAG: short-chain dehydrogenase [Gammaproteobacteria bacterium]|jgi:NAD(P)-dependent dehydrogenase (short-subunit alcohol dehydrogenase family)|nr:short-chain dehydrogenase [Gammaproteobacteria bacterium]
MSDRLKGKVALITGGTSGIGAATAELFIKEGATVVITGRSVEKGQALATALGERASYFEADITQEDAIRESIEQTAGTYGRLDVLFNNAGGPVGAPLDQLSQEHIDYGVKLLLSSAILGTKYAVEPMTASGGGCIINNSSIAGLRYRQGDLLYSALKAALTHYTRMAGIELGEHNIRVNSISPGAIATPIFWGGSARANTLSDEENERKMNKLQQSLARSVPLQKTGVADDIAEAALYLASDAGRFVTCHDLVVDGGRTSMFHEPS